MHTSLFTHLIALPRKARWCSAALVFLLSLSAAAQAQLKIFATVPEWGALAQELGGDKVSVFTATNALQDPHLIQARPGLLARARAPQIY
jgi:zinc/manganese transport system substrate-binding protein